MPYQQAVQLPKKPTGRRVVSDPLAGKTTTVGGASSQDCGRPTTRGRGDGGQSFSCPRGVQGKASAQLPCQEGDLPSGSMPSVPPPPAPEGTQPQWGGCQGPPSMIPRGWRQSFAAVVGGRTRSISSRSITNSVLPPLRRWNGRGSRSGSLTTSSPIRRKLWPSKKTTQLTSWPTSRTFFIRPPASTWTASVVSQAG